MEEEVKKIKEKEENIRKFKLLFDSSPEALIYTDKDFKVVDINPRFEEVFGYSIDEIRGKNINGFIVPEDKKEEGKKLDDMSKDRFIFYETVRKRKNGTLIPVSISATPLVSKGKIRGHIIMYEDITKRKETERKLSAIYDLLEEMTLSRDIDHISKIVMDATEKLLNFGNVDLFLIDEEKKELYVKESRGLKEPERYTVVPLYGEKGITAYVARTGRSVNIPDVRKDKRYLFGLKESRSELCVPMKVKDKVIGVIDAESKELNAFSEEDQRLLEILASQAAIAIENAKLFRELSSLKEFNETIVNSLNEGIWIEDEKGFCTYANPKMNEMLGYDTLIGKHWKEVVAPEEIDHMKKETSTRIYGRKSSYETILLRKDGKRIPVIVSATPLFEEGKFIGAMGIMINITEIKRAEEKLKDSEKLYRSLSKFNKTVLENSPVGIMNINKDMIVEYENPEMGRILGLPFGRELDAVWMNVKEIPSIEEAGISPIFDDLSEKKEISKEISFTDPYGEKIYLSLKGVPILEDSKFNGAVVIINDITERKKMEEELKKISQYLESVIDNANVWLNVLDEKSNVVIWNKAAEEISGYSREEVMGHDKIWEWLYPDEEYRKKVTETADAILKEGKVDENAETIICSKDGQTKIISWNSRRLLDEKGNIIGSIALGRDVTEQKKAEEALRRSEKHLRAIFDVSEEIIFTKDKDGHYTHINAVFSKIFKTPSEEIIGKTDKEIFPEEEAKKLREIDMRIIKTGKKLTYEDVLTVNDEIHIFRTTKAPLYNDAGESIGLCGFAEDITERKKMEEALKESEKKYRTTFENTGTAMAILEEDTTISLVNSQFAKLSKYSKEEIEEKMKWTKFVHPDDLKKMMEYHKKRRKNPEGVPKQYEFRAIDKNGNILNMLLNIDLIPGTKRSIISLIDITERKKIEEKIKRLHEIAAKMETLSSEEEIYKAAIEAAEKILEFDMCLIMVAEEDQLVVKFTSKEVPKESSRNMSFDEGIAGKTYRTRGSYLIGDIQKEKEASPSVNDYRSGISIPIGDLGVFQAMSKKINAFNKEDLKLGELLISHVSEALKRIQFEKILKGERDIAQKYLNIAGVMIVVVDVNQKINLINKKGCNILECNEREIIGKNWFDNFIPERNRKKSKETFEKLIRGEVKLKEYGEFSVLAKSGKEKIIAWHNTLLKDEKGNIIGVLSSGDDVTERKKIEESLKESEEKYKSLTNQLPIGIYRTTKEGKFLHANPALASILGYESVEELMKASAVNMYADPNIRKKQLEEWKANKGVISDEIKFRTKTGREIWVRDTGHVILNENGDISYIDGIIEDITERKKMEEELKKSKKDYQTIFENLPLVAFTLDRKGRILEANKWAEKITGLKLEDWKGKNFSKLGLLDKKELVKAFIEFRKNLQGKLTEKTIYNLKLKDGRRILLELIGIPLKENGKVTKVLDVGRDITEIKRAEEKLKESEERYRVSIESAPYGIAVIDQNQNGKFLIFNSQLEKITGYSRKEIPDIQRWLEKLYPDENYRKLVIKERNRIISEEYPRMREAVITRKNGEKRVCQFVSQTFSSGLRIVFISDITERKKAEEKIKYQNEMLRALYKTALVTSSALKLDDLLRMIYQEVNNLIKLDSFSISLVDKEKEELKFEITMEKGKSLGKRTRKLKPEECLSGYVVHLKKSLLIRDLDKEKDNLPVKLHLVGEPVRSWLGIPLIYENEVIGVMTVQSFKPNAFGEKEENLLTALAGQFTIAIKNAQLYEKTQEEIIHRKLLEQQKEKARKEAEFYSDLLGHDMGNLDQVILGYLYLLENAKDEETRNKNIKGIKKSIEKSKRLAESIKILKTIKNTKIEKFDLNKSIERSIKEIKDYFDREIEVNLDIKKRHYVKANDFLDKVFFNILENSVEYTFHDPVVIDIKTEEKEGSCNVHIRDSGIGISEEKKRDILKNLEVPSKRTGMGFYLAKKILDRFNGKFEIKDVKKGTEIIITLPVMYGDGKR